MAKATSGSSLPAVPKQANESQLAVRSISTGESQQKGMQASELLSDIFKDIPIPKSAPEFDEIMQGGKGFLPSLRFYSGRSPLVEQEKFPVNHYGLKYFGDDIPVNIGRSVDVQVLMFRDKAMSTADPDNFLFSTDSNSPVFKSIVERELNKAPNENTGCSFGREFLVWIPAVPTFATFFMGSASARIESKRMFTLNLIGKQARLSSKPVKNQKYSWQCPKIDPLNQPFDQLPNHEILRREIKTFLEPPESFDPEAIEARER